MAHPTKLMVDRGFAHSIGETPASNPEIATAISGSGNANEVASTKAVHDYSASLVPSGDINPTIDEDSTDESAASSKAVYDFVAGLIAGLQSQIDSQQTLIDDLQTRVTALEEA